MFIHEDFFSLTKAVEDEHGTTSTLQAVFFSAALGSKATLCLASRASSRSHARFGGHASSGWWSSPIAFANHSASHDTPWTSRAPVIPPHVPAIISSTAGLSFTHSPRLLFLDIQTHLTSKHDRLREEKHSHDGIIKTEQLSIYFTTHIIHWFAHWFNCLGPFVKHRFIHTGLTVSTDSVSLLEEQIQLWGCVQIEPPTKIRSSIVICCTHRCMAKSSLCRFMVNLGP